MNLAEIILTTTASSSAVVILSIYVIKNWFLTQLNKDLENHKFSLQREILKAQILATNSADVYKKLYHEIEVAYGAVSTLVSPFSTVNDWSKASPSEIESYLRKRAAASVDIAQAKDDFQKNDPDKAKKLNKLLVFLDTNDAEEKYRLAKNFLISNALFIDDQIEKEAHDILKLIYSGCVALQIYAQHSDRGLIDEEYRKDAELRKRIDGLKCSIKKILMPSN